MLPSPASWNRGRGCGSQHWRPHTHCRLAPGPGLHPQRNTPEGSGWGRGVVWLGKRAWHKETRPSVLCGWDLPLENKAASTKEGAVWLRTVQRQKGAKSLVGQAASKCPARRHLSREATVGVTAGPTPQAPPSVSAHPHQACRTQPSQAPVQGNRVPCRDGQPTPCRACRGYRQSPSGPRQPLLVCALREDALRTQSVVPFIFSPSCFTPQMKQAWELGRRSGKTRTANWPRGLSWSSWGTCCHG